MLSRLPRRFSSQFGPEKGDPGPKNTNFQTIKFGTLVPLVNTWELPNFSRIQSCLGSLGCPVGFWANLGPKRGLGPKNENFQKN